MRNVRLHGVLAQDELDRDFGVRQTTGNKSHDLPRWPRSLSLLELIR
jgi:hypothetical protein